MTSFGRERPAASLEEDEDIDPPPLPRPSRRKLRQRRRGRGRDRCRDSTDDSCSSNESTNSGSDYDSDAYTSGSDSDIDVDIVGGRTDSEQTTSSTIATHPQLHYQKSFRHAKRWLLGYLRLVFLHTYPAVHVAYEGSSFVFQVQKELASYPYSRCMPLP
jgi:hypothetical protein